MKLQALPILCLADNDPGGPHISIKPVALATVIKQPYLLLMKQHKDTDKKEEITYNTRVCNSLWFLLTTSGKNTVRGECV